PIIGERVTFDASGCIEPGTNVISYTWDFGDGTPTDIGIKVNHIYQQPGDYWVTLAIITDQGSKSVTLPIYVSGGNTGEAAKEKIQRLDKGGTHISDPVDSATGAHVIERTLMTTKGAQPIAFVLNYNSLLLNEGQMGKGWGHNFETYLETLVDGNINIHWTANRVNKFIRSGSKFSSADLATRFDILIRNNDGSYTLARRDQEVYKFDSTGKLTQIENGHGQFLTLSYNASGQLEKITEPVTVCVGLFFSSLDRRK
ncbi:MAG: PKD domain-containing protein, partial [Bacillota bacterium]|nr:PKD domain-containing protein [Bacillota bacterium]